MVELVGPPGAGKTTIFKALRSRDQGIATMPSLRRKPYRGVLARHLASTLATIARHRALGRRWSRESLMNMTYVRGLPPVLGEPDWSQEVVVFDQGPIFTLSRPFARDDRLALWRGSSVAT